MHIGMIFQFNEGGQVGQVMFADGTKLDFSLLNWADTENQPSIGKKVSCENDNGLLKMKLATMSDQIGDAPVLEVNKVKASSQKGEVEEELGSVEEYIKYFSKNGFNLVKDSQEDGVRNVSLRLYTPREYGEVSIKDNGTKISVTQTMNGETAVNT